MKSVKVLSDPEVFQLLADKTRRNILYLLRVKGDMTASQLATEMKLTPQTVYHHVKKLVKGELLEVKREERVGHLIERYYGPTAETIILHHGRMRARVFRDEKSAKEHVMTILNVLKKLGYDFKFDENKISRLAGLQIDMEKCCGDFSKLEDAIYNITDLDLFTLWDVETFAKTFLMSDEEFARQHEIRKKFRDLLSSLLKKKKPG